MARRVPDSIHSASAFSEALVDLPTDLLESEEIRLMGPAAQPKDADRTWHQIKIELIRCELRSRIKKGGLKGTKVSDEFVKICSEYYGGMNTMMYACCSTGNIKLGTQRPMNHEADRPMTDQEWHIRLWKSLRQEFKDTIHSYGMPKSVEEAKELLRLFVAKEFCDSIVTDLETSYGIEEKNLLE